VEPAGSRQRVRKGPVTGPLDRPSQQPLETRKAVDHIRPAGDAIRFARKTVASIHAAELQMLAATQRAARRHALGAVDAMLRDRHASNIALVIARFSSRRAALSLIPDTGARAAAGQQLAAEEANELARLALEHAAEKRQMRKAATTPLRGAHIAARRTLRRRQRHQRAVVAIQLQALVPPRSGGRLSNRSDGRHHVRKTWHSQPGVGGKRQ
jgi:hypothetical protein